MSRFTLLLALPLLLLIGCVSSPAAPPPTATVAPTQDLSAAVNATLTALALQQTPIVTATPQPTATAVPATATVAPTTTSLPPTPTTVPTASPHPQLTQTVGQYLSNSQSGQYFNALDNSIDLTIDFSGQKSFSPVYELNNNTDDFAVRFEVMLGEHPRNECLVHFGNVVDDVDVAGEDQRRVVVIYRQGNVGYVDITWYSLNGWASIQSPQTPGNLQFDGVNTVIVVKQGNVYTVIVNGTILTFTDPNVITAGPLLLQGTVNSEISVPYLACTFQNVQWFIPSP